MKMMCIFLSCPWLISLIAWLKSIFSVMVLLLATIMGYAAETTSLVWSLGLIFFFFHLYGIHEKREGGGGGVMDDMYTHTLIVLMLDWCSDIGQIEKFFIL